MKKRYFLIILILLLTGCNVDYKVDINKDLEVIENVTITETQELYNSYYRTSKLNVLKRLLSYEKSILESNNYHYEIIDDKDPYILITKKYKNIDEYVNNTIFYKNYFDNLKYVKDKKIVSLETLNYTKVDIYDLDKYIVDDLNISLNSYYKIVDSNSVITDKKNNIYKWKMNNDNPDDYKISLTIDTGKVFINPIYYYIGIIIIVIVIVWIIIISYYKKKKKVLLKKKM